MLISECARVELNREGELQATIAEQGFSLLFGTLCASPVDEQREEVSRAQPIKSDHGKGVSSRGRHHGTDQAIRLQWVIASYLQMRTQAGQGTTGKYLVSAPKPLALESWYMFNSAHQRNNITSNK